MASTGIRSLLRLAGGLAVLSAVLSGCGARSLPSAGGPGVVQGTPVPTATPAFDPLGYQITTPLDCKVLEDAALQTYHPQGDLLAWAPSGPTLAYAAPADRYWGWYAGAAVVATLGETAEEWSPADVRVAGDLTWSPDGSQVAAVGWRTADDLFTILTLDPGRGSVTDWFPGDAARSDAWSGQKGVAGWQGPTRLQVTTACGDDCSRLLEIDLRSGEISPVKDLRRVEDDSLAIQVVEYAYDPAGYPAMFNPIWSPDHNQAVFGDREGGAWLLWAREKSLARLEFRARQIEEAKWSADGSLLALRADGRVVVYRTQPGCVAE